MDTSQSVARRYAANWLGTLGFGNHWLSWLEYLCWIVGLAAVGWFVFVWANTIYFQTTQARRFAELRGSGLATAPLRTGELLGKLTIARIGLSAVVLEGDDEQTLRHAVGHIPGTSLPDAACNVALAGHRDTFFRNLGSLRENDVIVLETRNGTHRYRVATTEIVDPADVAILQSSGRPTLTLVTCYPFYYIGPAPRRFVVIAWGIAEGRHAPAQLGINVKTATPIAAGLQGPARAGSKAAIRHSS
jgi:sortase A